MGNESRLSTYLANLPAVLQEGPFLGRFLLAFEAILHGLPSSEGVESLPVGLSVLLDRMHTNFDPLGERDSPETRAPAEMLPWLAQWMATSLWDDWNEETKRNFLAHCISLYRRRGTRSGLEELLRVCVTPMVKVIELDDPAPAHYFLVELAIAEKDPDKLKREARMVRAIVDREKPVHTFYGLRLLYPAMQIINDPGNDPQKGIHVGITTILGTMTY